MESARSARHLLKQLVQQRALLFESLPAVGLSAEQAPYPGPCRGKKSKRQGSLRERPCISRRQVSCRWLAFSKPPRGSVQSAVRWLETTNLNKLPRSVQLIVPLPAIEISATFVFYRRDKQRLLQRFSVPSPSSFIGVVLQRLRSPFRENLVDMSPNRSPNPSA